MNGADVVLLAVSIMPYIVLVPGVNPRDECP
jgi:hypothetical protein